MLAAIAYAPYGGYGHSYSYAGVALVRCASRVRPLIDCEDASVVTLDYIARLGSIFTC